MKKRRFLAVMMALMMLVGMLPSAQAMMVKQLEELLTGREKDVVRFGRNAHTNTVPKNADIMEYHAATGFEALIGYLKLSGQEERLGTIMDKVFEIADAVELERD